MRVAVAVCIAALSAAARPAPAPADPMVLAPRLEASFLQMATPAPWPSFDARGIPLAIWEDPATWFFRHPHPPAGCTPMASNSLGCRLAGRHDAMHANSSVQIESTMTATLLVPPSWPAASSDSTWVLAAVAIHEAFHVFQRQRHPKWQANEVDLFTYPSESESLVAQSGLELEALRRALEARDPKVAASWAAIAMQERATRFAAMPANAVTYERANEWNEGLAQYVQNRALQAAAPHLGAPRILAKHTFPADAIRDRVYVSGEAMARLLDRFAPGWQDSLEADDLQPLDRLLANHTRPSDPPAATFTAAERAAAQRAGAASVAALRRDRAAARERFFAQPGPQLVVEVAAGEPLWPALFDPLNVQLIGAGEVLHERFLQLANATTRVEVLDRSVLSQAAGTHPLFEGVRRLTITGLPAAPVVQASDSTTVVRAAGVEVTARGARVERNGDVTRLVLGR